MSTVPAPWGLSIAEAGEGGSIAAPFPRTPSLAHLLSYKQNQPQPVSFFRLDLRLSPHWNRTLLSGSSRMGIKT